MHAPSIVQETRERLAAMGSAERAAGARAYLKSNLDFLGVATPQIRLTARTLEKQHPHLAVHDLRCLVQALWDTSCFELKALAVALLERNARLLTPPEMPLVEGLLRTSHTWALVDMLATKAAGSLARRFPPCMAQLSRWAVDDDFWIRRSALLALLDDLRAGGGDFALFARLAQPMLGEKEFFIRKAIGWVLRDVGKKRPGLVRDFLLAHGALASGLTWREATRCLPPTMQAELAEYRRTALV